MYLLDVASWLPLTNTTAAVSSMIIKRPNANSNPREYDTKYGMADNAFVCSATSAAVPLTSMSMRKRAWATRRKGTLGSVRQREGTCDAQSSRYMSLTRSKSARVVAHASPTSTTSRRALSTSFAYS